MSLIDYDKTLSILLQEEGFGGETQNPHLTSILNLMEKFPNFVFGENLNISMKDLFLEKYDIIGIGAETNDLFLHFWKEKTNELLIKYVPKIKMWLDNFNDLFKFTVKLKKTENELYSSGNQNTYYLNPITATTGVSKSVVVDEENKTTTTNYSGGNLKVQDVDSSDENGQNRIESERDVLQTVWGKTRADILKKIFELTDIYNECIKEYGVIFMGVI